MTGETNDPKTGGEKPPVTICTADAPLRALLEDGLKRAGFAAAATDRAADAPPGAWLLCDPERLDGDLVRALDAGGVHILALLPAATADRPEDDRLPRGVATLALPFRFGALLDRLSRTDRAAPALPIAIGPWRLDPQDNILAAPDHDFSIRLTEKERDILIRLHRAGGEVVTREELLEEVWGYAPDIETHTLETHIYRLRRKIESDAAQPLLLVTEEKGYRLRPS